jgi:hypothetical protein
MSRGQLLGEATQPGPCKEQRVVWITSLLLKGGKGVGTRNGTALKDFRS